MQINLSKTLTSCSFGFLFSTLLLSMNAQAERDNRIVRSPIKQYQTQLDRITHRYSIYPDEALLKENTGKVTIKITLDKTGNVLRSAIVEKADFEPLNIAALNAVKNAKYPAFPAEIKEPQKSFIIIQEFKVPKIKNYTTMGRSS